MARSEGEIISLAICCLALCMIVINFALSHLIVFGYDFPVGSHEAGWRCLFF